MIKFFVGMAVGVVVLWIIGVIIGALRENTKLQKQIDAQKRKTIDYEKLIDYLDYLMEEPKTKPQTPEGKARYDGAYFAVKMIKRRAQSMAEEQR